MKDLEKRVSIIEEKLGISKETLKLEVGKWYLYTGHLCECKPLIFITSISGTNSKFRGFDYQGKWTDSDFYQLYELDKYGYREATNQEVELSLIEEAKRRCLEGEFSIKEPIRNDFSRIVSIGGTYSYNDGSDTLFYGGVVIYYKGKWAEKVEQKVDKFAELKEAHRNGDVIEMRKYGAEYWLETPFPSWNNDFEYRIKPTQQSYLEQDIQQLKDKYKQYKFTITIEDNL